MSAPSTSNYNDMEKLESSLRSIELKTSELNEFIDTATAIAQLLDLLATIPLPKPSLFVDLEGVHLGRNGTMSIMQLFVFPLEKIFLIDVHILSDKVFSTTGSSGNTLKEILESSSIPKVFFDVRNDSDALFSLFGIDLAGIIDIQLMELATRGSKPKKYVNGLAKCIQSDVSLSLAELKEWKSVKEKGHNLFAPERGGSYEVFNIRPLPAEIRAYCTQDVLLMPKLWAYYTSRMSLSWASKLHDATVARVVLSQSKSYNGHGKHKALGPENWS